MIILKKIKLFNFLSHESTEIEFKEDQKLLIDGDSGSGKSAIVEAIIWGLYGKGRSDNRSLIKRGKKSLTVTLILNDIDKEGGLTSYVVKRSVTSTGKHDLSISEQDKKGKMTPIKVSGIKNVQEHLEKEILHSSYLLFINSIAHPQDNVENFVKQTAAKRKDIILEIINATDYDEYHEKAKDKLKEFEIEDGKVDTNIEGLNFLITQNNEKAKELPKWEENAKELTKELKTLKARTEELNQRLIKVNIAHTKVEEKEKQLTFAENKVIDLKQTVNILNKQLIELDGSKIKELQEYVKDLDIFKEKVEDLKKLQKAAAEWNEKMLELTKEQPVGRNFDDEIKEVNEQIIALMSEKTDTLECPKCGFEIDALKQDREIRIGKLTELLNEKNKQRDDYAEQYSLYLNKVEAQGKKPIFHISELKALEITLHNKQESKIVLDQLIHSASNKKQTLEEDLKKANKELTDIEKEIATTTTELEPLKNLAGHKEHTENELEINKNDIANAERNKNFNLEWLTDAKTAKKNVENNTKKLEGYSKEKTELDKKIEAMKLLKEAFGSKGLKAIIIDYVIPKLEDKINDILSKLSDFRIRLDTQKEGVTEDTVLEGLFISIFNEHGEEFDFDNYSGGERLKIIVAISEALSEIQNISFRILDELFIGLDENSTEKFAEVITSLQERFNQLICISHLRNIKDIFHDRLMVTKQNGTSRIN